MSTYVISDIHGHYDEFQEMLSKIKFTDKDKMIIAGDIVDRGSQSLEMIKYVMNHKDNISMIMGNHEYMMLNCYKRGSLDNFNIWFSNGGKSTYSQIEECSDDEINDIISWIKTLSYSIEVEVGEKIYVICHADPFAAYSEDMVWNRISPEYEVNDEDEENKIYIVGHTPVIRYLDKNTVAKIIKSNDGKLLFIDGGAAYPIFKQSRLLCLRLEDLKEYSVPVKIC